MREMDGKRLSLFSTVARPDSLLARAEQKALATAREYLRLGLRLKDGGVLAGASVMVE